MKPLLLRIAHFGLPICTLTLPVAAEEELKLRSLKPIIAQLERNSEPDMSEFQYVAARGAALFMALSGYITENAANDRDRKMAQDIQMRGVPYYQVALTSGLMTKKSTEKTNEQIKLLLETYLNMIVKSKQLNNELLSPAILEDLEALKAIESTIMQLAETAEKGAQAK